LAPLRRRPVPAAAFPESTPAAPPAATSASAAPEPERPEPAAVRPVPDAGAIGGWVPDLVPADGEAPSDPGDGQGDFDPLAEFDDFDDFDESDESDESDEFDESDAVDEEELDPPVDERAGEIPAEPEPTAEPMRPRAHRINGRWGRFAELWVPEPLRNSRVDPGRRGMIVLVLVAAVAAVVAAVGVWRDRPEPRPVETSMVAAAGQLTVSASSDASGATGSASASPPPTLSEILVSVTGLVVNPGVVRLPPDARVADAIAAAGGTGPGANLTGMNLAARLADGDSVVVNDTGVAAGSASGATGAAAAGSGAGSGGPAAGGLVNLNTADAAALDTLPGVGPVMAQNIIAWRSEHGKFSSVEQLQEISGIGPSRYAQISALVTVG
jgi:competence protein ComEA